MSILNPLFEAVAWVIMRIHAGLSVPFGASSGWAWGLSIVLLVMLMRLIMVPLFVKQVRSQRKMQSHMPQLQELRKRYKSDKQRLNEETMKFYKENGINPLGGCLPLVAQLPVFWALFNVLRAIADWTAGAHSEVRADGPGRARARRTRASSVRRSADKFLFPRPRASRWTSRSGDLGVRAGQRRHHLPDDAAEPEARHDAAGPGGPGPARPRASMRST